MSPAKTHQSGGIPRCLPRSALHSSSVDSAELTRKPRSRSPGKTPQSARTRLMLRLFAAEREKNVQDRSMETASHSPYPPSASRQSPCVGPVVDAQQFPEHLWSIPLLPQLAAQRTQRFSRTAYPLRTVAGWVAPRPLADRARTMELEIPAFSWRVRGLHTKPGRAAVVTMIAPRSQQNGLAGGPK